MALKWTKSGGSRLESGNWSIKPCSDKFWLRVGWNFICMLDSEAACKRVANCIQREFDRAKLTDKKS